MASIIKRKKNYSIVYTYVDENGETKQKWETRTSYQEALKRKAEIESQKSSNFFLPPTNQNIAEFLSDFVSLYGEKRWGVSMYDSQNSLIANYINPIIGDMKVQDVTTRVVDKYIQTLQETPAVNTRTHHAKTEFVTNATIEKIIKLLRCAFKQAVRWELVAKNPFDNVVLPKVEYKKRDIWTADMIRTALDQCTDSKLYVAMNLAFACSLRMGEILGLTWSNVHISDEDIADDNAYVYIDKELVRASKRAIEMLGQKDIYHVFTPLFPNTSTRIILKKPKTDSSIRKVWLPKPLAYILREWKSAQDELRALLRDEYQDYDLVVALANGRPCEDRIILKSFEKLREKAGLPKVVFHSLRHSSTTYKLKLNHGGDDLSAMREALTRRFEKVTQNDERFAELPDLLITDGGRTQLNVALEVLSRFGLDYIPAIGLAERNEEIIVPDREESIILPRGDGALHFIQRIRDEAHRFAISYHRSLHVRSALMSELDNIDGIGDKRKRLLFDAFVTRDAIAAATKEQLCAVKGMNKTAAQAVYDHFHHQEDSQ